MQQTIKYAALKGSQEMPINDIVNKIDMPAKSKVDRTVTIGSKVYTLNDYNNTFYELNKIKKVLSPIEWQRLISELAIRGYGSLKPTLLRPIIIAIRPNGKVVIIDGQHRVALILNTLDPDNIPPLFVQEYVHDKNLSEDECKKIESYLFKNLNVEYKSLNKMTIIRSGV